MTYADVVAVQVYLTDMNLFQRMNAIYTTYFKTDRPSRDPRHNQARCPGSPH